MIHKCVIPHCQNMLSDRARLPECAACRSVFRYWMKRAPDDIIKRQNALNKWQDRMLHLADSPRGDRRHAKAIKKTILTRPKGKSA